MTVGIAAVSQGMLFLASDRMLTAGDIQFQPASHKTLFLTNSIAILFSGQTAFHAEVVQEVSGARHAESQFMFDSHAFNRPGIETLFTLYSAKKASEIAPGVGDQTDLYSIGPGLGQNSIFPAILTEKLDEAYQKARADQRKARDDAAVEIQRFVETALEQRAEQQEPSDEEEGKSVKS